MSAASAPEVVLALVASAHLGFQATVTVLVYPALAGLADEPTWARAHPRPRGRTPVWPRSTR
ncbi:hypothetical protein [Nocardioides salarius]|uniref:hypothetical protein n=1 Tax=Nocardioides salarius TaxID=374513 RepID=UPI0030F722F7